MSQPKWNAIWREKALPQLAVQDWDLLVIGGGICGAGILREAARCGWSCLLLEQRDFAWGTSSRSSKMVHGGLRYIAKGQFALTRDSVRERQRLLDEAPGLVEPLSYLFPHYQGQFPGPKVFGGLLAVYDALAGKRNHLYYPLQQLRFLLPGIREQGLVGATRFYDAVTDDARLVMRVLGEARADGAEALNGLKVIELLRENDQVCGVLAEDSESGKRFIFRSRAVAQATGAWADALRQKTGPEHIRPLRGSHLLLPHWRLPMAHAVSFMHESDQRPVFVFPWEGATVIGTTDLDHHESLNQDARISTDEVEYLLAACSQKFPDAQIKRDDVLSSWAGVRPVVSDSDDRAAPSDEKREHMLWVEPGCVTLAGGKLTTFRLLAQEVLEACARFVGKPVSNSGQAVFRPLTDYPLPGLTVGQKRRLSGRHGQALPQLAALLDELGGQPIASLDTLWIELAQACDNELVLHLDDLLLRRTRIGLLLANGAEDEMPKIRALCQQRLSWSDDRWHKEVSAYRQLWQSCYSLPTQAEQSMEHLN